MPEVAASVKKKSEVCYRRRGHARSCAAAGDARFARQTADARTSFWVFLSSRSRHPRSTRDWSSDVCSSDLSVISSNQPTQGLRRASLKGAGRRRRWDRKSAVEGKSVVLGGRRMMKKKKK